MVDVSPAIVWSRGECLISGFVNRSDVTISTAWLRWSVVMFNYECGTENTFTAHRCHAKKLVTRLVPVGACLVSGSTQFPVGVARQNSSINVNQSDHLVVGTRRGSVSGSLE
jgi:hypothetical protein